MSEPVSPMTGAPSGHCGIARGSIAETVAPALVAMPMALPIVTILVLALASGDSGTFLDGSQLFKLAATTFWLCLLTASLALAIGLMSAWLVAAHDFPGRNLLSWMAFLPLAMPGYIIAFVYVDFFTFSGPLQSQLRELTGWKAPADYYFPDIRSTGGAAIVFALVLYPYIYMAARSAFARLPASQVMAARSLGRSPLATFFAVVLPQARAALAIGVALVIMECLNDIGSVSFFGVRTFALAIFSTWLDQGSLGGAAQLALLMLAVIFALVLGEQYARRHDGLPKAPAMGRPVQRSRLVGAKGVCATMAVFLPVFFGFLLPAFLLLQHGLNRFDGVATAGFARALMHSVLLAAAVAGIAMLLALVLAFGNRQAVPRFLANLGYAIPGTILAIGVIVPFSLFDHGINALTQRLFGVSPGLILSGSVVALVFAHVARFLVIATSMLDSGAEKIPVSLGQAARTLGRTSFRGFVDVKVPLLKPAMAAGALLVFVDAMKELPATLLLRPFDFETLSTLAFTSASLGQIEEAALPALAIVLAGLAPVYLLMSALSDSRD